MAAMLFSGTSDFSVLWFHDSVRGSFLYRGSERTGQTELLKLLSTIKYPKNLEIAKGFILYFLN